MKDRLTRKTAKFWHKVGRLSLDGRPICLILASPTSATLRFGKCDWGFAKALYQLYWRGQHWVFIVLKMQNEYTRFYIKGFILFINYAWSSTVPVPPVLCNVWHFYRRIQWSFLARSRFFSRVFDILFAPWRTFLVRTRNIVVCWRNIHVRSRNILDCSRNILIPSRKSLVPSRNILVCSRKILVWTRNILVPSRNILVLSRKKILFLREIFWFLREKKKKKKKKKKSFLREKVSFLREEKILFLREKKIVSSRNILVCSRKILIWMRNIPVCSRKILVLTRNILVWMRKKKNLVCSRTFFFFFGFQFDPCRLSYWTTKITHQLFFRKFSDKMRYQVIAFNYGMLCSRTLVCLQFKVIISL